MSLIPKGPRLRLWYIAETYPPDYGGGAAIYIKDVARALATCGHDVRVLCAEGTEEEPYSVRTDFDGAVRVDRVNLPYFKQQDPDGWQLGLSAWKAHEQRVARVIKNVLDGWRPDLVHYSASRPFGEECLVTVRTMGLPIVGFL